MKLSLVLSLGTAIFGTLLGGAIAHAEEWNTWNNPNNFNRDWHPVNVVASGGYETKLGKLPTDGRLPLEKTPWSDSYWPKNRGSFAYRWLDFQNSGRSPDLTPDQLKKLFFQKNFYSADEVATLSEQKLANLSPLEKYSIFVGDFSYHRTKKFLKLVNAETAYWEGYCHAWSAAASQYAEPTPVTVDVPIRTRNGTKIINLPFGAGDIKALLVADFAQLRWGRDIFNEKEKIKIAYVGQMCKQRFIYPSSKMKNGKEVMADFPDIDGLLDSDLEKTVMDYQQAMKRVDPSFVIDPDLPKKSREAANSDACRDTNAGALHIVMANELGVLHRPILMDKTRDVEVWNQPIYRYESKIEGYAGPKRTSAPGTMRVATVSTSLFYADDTDYGWTFWNPTLAGMFGWNLENSQKYPGVIDYFTPFTEEYNHYQDMLIKEGDLDARKLYPTHTAAHESYKYTLDLDAADNIIGGDWISLARPDDLYIIDKVGFIGDYDRLSELYKPLKLAPGVTAPLYTDSPVDPTAPVPGAAKPAPGENDDTE